MEKVNHPEHYNKPGRKECIVEMEEKYGKQLTITFCLLSAYKYLYRAGDKPGEDKLEDVKKAQWYFNYVDKLQPSHVLGRGRSLVKLYIDIEKELSKVGRSLLND